MHVRDDGNRHADVSNTLWVEKDIWFQRWIMGWQNNAIQNSTFHCIKNASKGGKRERDCVYATSQSGSSLQRALQRGLETSSGEHLTAKKKSREKGACRGEDKKVKGGGRSKEWGRGGWGVVGSRNSRIWPDLLRLEETRQGDGKKGKSNKQMKKNRAVATKRRVRWGDR